MAHFCDLEPWPTGPPHDAEDNRLVAVGWLEARYDYPKGEVFSEFFARLCELVTGPCPTPWRSCGYHVCTLCRSDEPVKSGFGHPVLPYASDKELLVPGTGLTCVTPFSIAHYVDAHEYCPPEEFQIAVVQCPPLGSSEYVEALRLNGARTVAEAIERSQRWEGGSA